MPSITDEIAEFRTHAEAIQARIEAACSRVQRNPAEVRLIWVSKNHPRERLLAAHAAGARLFGENRVQEVVEKFPLTAYDGSSLDAELHFIGHLQRNKVRKVLPLCAAFHSVDTVELWETLDRTAKELDVQRDVFLQINTSNEPQKSGFSKSGFLFSLSTLPEATHLRLVGLMTMGPVEGGTEAARPCFRALRLLLKELREHPVFGPRFPDAQNLSMGMSGDFEVAIEEGANYVRIGSALFGER